VLGRERLVVGRSEGYTGILVDDLISKGADEPYRMFTSRAEFRLHLRIDNADERLTPLGRRAGLVDERRWSRFQRKLQQKEAILSLLDRTRTGVLPGLTEDPEDRPTLRTWLRRPEAGLDSRLIPWLEDQLGEAVFLDALATIETQEKYSGYIQQQERQMERLKRSEGRRIPSDLDFAAVVGLSREVSERLARVRPETLGQAGRIPGVTPAAIAVLEVHLALR
jgi:tRNA uridine 5-carboxymethylaminomethyl modification enzyme